MIDDNAFLTFNSTAEIGTTGTVKNGSDNTITIGNSSTLDLFGWNTSIFGNNATIIEDASIKFTSITGTHNTIILRPGDSVSDTSADLDTDNIGFDLSSGGNLTLDAGTFNAPSQYADSGQVGIPLVVGDPLTLGTLTFNTSDGTDGLTLTDGMVINLPGVTGQLTVAAPAAGTTPLQTLEDYLTDLGDSTDAGNLIALNDAYLNPTGTAHPTQPVQVGRIGNTNTVQVVYADSTPGATFIGEDQYGSGQYAYTAYNILAAGYNITRDRVDNIQELYADAALTLNQAEFNSFDLITGNPTGALLIDAAMGGTFDLKASSVDQGILFYLTATGWSGTTLIGNDQDSQVLTASLLGNDRLQAGNGIGDVLNAGSGVDTLIGGSGGDRFVASGELAEGSLVTGKGSGNVLEVVGDITGVTISDIQTLSATNSITLTAAEFAGFDAINATELFAATAGIYDLTTKGWGAASADLTALSDDGTTLIGSSGNNLIASPTGDDTLEGDGSLTAGGGADMLEGDGSIYAEDGLAPGSVVEGTGPNATLYAGGDISGATILSLATLVVTSDLTLTGDELANVGTVEALYEGYPPTSFNLYAASPGTYDLTNKGAANLDLIPVSVGGLTLIGTGNNTIIAGSRADVLESSGLILTPNGLPVGSTVEGTGPSATLDVGGDISGATISIATLIATSNLTFTPDELSNVGHIVPINGAELYAATSGTYDLAGKGDFNLVAGGGSVTLIGFDLTAGAGVDVLEGSGYIHAENGLTAGSAVKGIGQDATLYAGGDISGATVSGIAALVVTNDLTLTAAELANVGTVVGADGTRLFAPTGGTYDLLSGSDFGTRYASGSNVFDMIAVSPQGTTLEEQYAHGATLTASHAGDDTLIVSNGGSNTLDASASIGNVTLDASGESPSLSSSGSPPGMDTLYAGAGIDTIYADGAVIYGGAGTATITDSVFEGGNIIYGGSGDLTVHTAQFGGNAIYAGSGKLTVYNSDSSSTTVTSDDGGTVVVEPGNLTGVQGVDPNAGYVQLDVDSGTVEIVANEAFPVKFGSHSQPLVLRLDQPQDFSETVYGLAPGDIVNLPSVSYSSSISTEFNPFGSLGTTDILAVLVKPDLFDAANFGIDFVPSQTLVNPTFQISQDGGGTDITIDGDAWTTGTSGHWSDANAWGVKAAPTSTSFVTLGGSATYTVTLDVAASVASLTLSDSLATFNLAGQTLTVSGTTTVSGGIIDLIGRLEAGTVALDGGSGAITVAGLASTLVAGFLSVGGTSTEANGQGLLSITYGADVSVGNVQIWNTGTISLTGGTLATDPLTVAAGGQISGNGVITGDIDNFSTIIATGGTLELTGEISGTGTLAIAPNSVLTLDGPVDPGVIIDFASGGTLNLDLMPAVSSGPLIENFFAGDTIDLKGLTYVAGSTSPNYTTATGILQVTNRTQTASINFGAGNSLVDDPFHVAPDGTGGTMITNDAVMCFCRGTLIGTDAGDVAVERLRIGDTALTLAGQARRIVWLGQGKVLATRYRRTAATPVIVRKGALADNVPTRDLHITKAHGLYIDGVLIPVEFLVNHRTILWDDRAQEVEIYHIELASHDVLMANGAPAESYRDDGNRWLFQNANSGWHLPPQAPCAPVLTGGPVVDAAWRRLLDRAGPRYLPPLTDDPDLHLIVDGQRVSIAGQWGQDRLFRLAGCPSSVHIASRDAVPAELGLARDPRSLGVALRRVALRQGAKLQVIEASDPSLDKGFHGFEPEDELRWTNGYATLPAAALSRFGDGEMEIVLTLAGTTRYPDSGQELAVTAA